MYQIFVYSNYANMLCAAHNRRHDITDPESAHITANHYLEAGRHVKVITPTGKVFLRHPKGENHG